MLDELAECVTGVDDTEKRWEEKALREEINRFTLTLSEEKRYIFILRYWYVDSISEIAKQLSISENNVSVSLSRIRGKLKAYLIERGFDV